MSNESEREYGWDDEIQNDGPNMSFCGWRL